MAPSPARAAVTAIGRGPRVAEGRREIERHDRADHHVQPGCLSVLAGRGRDAGLKNDRGDEGDDGAESVPQSAEPRVGGDESIQPLA
jgi:hypothetical protein